MGGNCYKVNDKKDDIIEKIFYYIKQILKIVDISTRNQRVKIVAFATDTIF